MAVSRLDGRGFRYPGPFPRIAAGLQPVTRPLLARWTRSAPSRWTLSTRLGKSLAATLTRIADGVFFAEVRVALSLAADFRRARNHLLCTVFRFGKPDSVLRSVFLYRRPLPCLTTC